MPKFVWGSVRHQKDVAKSIGYNPDDFDPNNEEEVSKFSFKAISALLSGKDKDGKQLSPDDMSLLSRLTGRG